MNLLNDMLRIIINENNLIKYSIDVIENNNHLHCTVKSKTQLKYIDIKNKYPGWHVYLRQKSGTELRVWLSYIQKDIPKDEYQFID